MKDQLINKIKELYSPESYEKVCRAIDFAEKAHDGQKRSSGEPFVIHPIEVANILFDMGMDIDTICAGILHDTIEDTGAKLEQLESLFGAEVAMLVDGVTK